MRMRRVNWTITEIQHKELKKLSQLTGLSISELVRRAIDKYIGLMGEGSESWLNEEKEKEKKG
jgi:16S rRNA U516 pseudouridylate synthase RsuA-like enzyme